jgi:histidine triad (HIT) family protein
MRVFRSWSCSVHEPEGYECPFCRIAAGHLPGRVVHRTEDVMVLVNIKWWPNNPGGLLVVPVKHHENVYELPPDLGMGIQWAVRAAAKALKSAFACDGVSTRQHNEPAGNQDVWHHHTHVFPRWHGDDLYKTNGERVPLEEVERVALVVRDHWPEWEPWYGAPGKPGAAGVVLRDSEGRILIVEPTYRETWNVPGGAIERRESPRAAAIRETLEEIGLDIEPGALLSVDHRPTEPDSMHFIFDGPTLTPEQIGAIRLPLEELRSFRFATLEEAEALLNPPLFKRIKEGLAQPGIYLENGMPMTNPATAATHIK